MTDVQVEVFHNFTEPAIPFHADDQLCRVARFSISMAADETPDAVQALLAIVFDQLNRDVPTTDWARDYRARCNRGLAAGDVLTIGEQAWAYEAAGWRRVMLIDDQIWVGMGRARDGGPLFIRA